MSTIQAIKKQPKPFLIIRDVNKLLGKINKSELEWSEKIALSQLCRAVERRLKD